MGKLGDTGPIALFPLPTLDAGPGRGAAGHWGHLGPWDAKARELTEPATRTQNPCHQSPRRPAMDVYCTPAAALDSLVTSSLQPTAEFVGTARRALGALGAVLRELGGRPSAGEAAAPPWRVLKITKVGSQEAGATSRSPFENRGGQGRALSVFSFISLSQL